MLCGVVVVPVVVVVLSLFFVKCSSGRLRVRCLRFVVCWWFM